MEREVKIMWNGREEVVVLKKLTWGEMNEVLKQAVGKIKFVGAETPVVDFDPVAFKEILLLKSIKRAPFNIDLETLRNLDAEVADQLAYEAMQLNPLSRFF